MKSNYTTFIADLEVTNSFDAIEEWTTLVYKTDDNKLFVRDVQLGRFVLNEIKESDIKHVYG